MTKSTTLPPDITVTRADVLALPICGEYRSGLDDGPNDGHVWTLALVDDRCVWVEAPEDATPDERSRYANDGDGDGTGWLTDREASIAERAFLWQTALASDAALADIDNDPAPSAPPTVHGDRLATIRSVIAEETAKAIRRVAVGGTA